MRGRSAASICAAAERRFGSWFGQFIELSHQKKTMPINERHRDAGRPLQLTEPRGNPDSGLLIDENVIRRLVDTFYD